MAYGAWTNWGFFKYGWVTAKWVLTIAQIMFGTFFLGPWLDTSVDIAFRLRGAAFADPLFISYSGNTRFWGPLQVSLVVFMVVLSVIKPMKRA